MYVHFICRNCREVSTNDVDINKFSQKEFTRIHAKVRCSECKFFSFIHVVAHLEPIPRQKNGDAVVPSAKF